MAIQIVQQQASSQPEVEPLSDDQLETIVGGMAAPINTSAGNTMIQPPVKLLVTQPKEPGQ